MVTIASPSTSQRSSSPVQVQATAVTVSEEDDQELAKRTDAVITNLNKVDADAALTMLCMAPEEVRFGSSPGLRAFLDSAWFDEWVKDTFRMEKRKLRKRDNSMSKLQLIYLYLESILRPMECVEKKLKTRPSHLRMKRYARIINAQKFNRMLCQKVLEAIEPPSEGH